MFFGQFSFWPSSVPEKLWSDAPKISGTITSQILPLSSYPISKEMLGYFLIGLVVVWLYSWNRFNRRSYEPGPLDYRVLRELQPAQMRDSLLMQRAFMMYGLILSFIYVTFSFFGGVILNIIKTIPAVGPLGLDQQAMQSPQWPLVVAFGLAGLTQLIGPFDNLEKMLRGHIHRSLGIPISIKEYTRQLVAVQLENLTTEAKEHSKPAENSTIESSIQTLSDGRVVTLHAWAREEIKQTYGLEDVLAKLILLWRMIDSLYSPNWPRENVRDEMRPLLFRQLQDGRAAASHLSDLLSTRQAPPEATTTNASDDSASIGTTAANPEPQRTRQEQQLIAAIERMERHLYEIAAIHVVYAQRDRNYDKIKMSSVKKAVETVFKDDLFGPSARQVASATAIIFIGYCVAITWLNQQPMTSMPHNPWTIGITATYETLRNLCVFVFPALFAIYMTTSDTVAPNNMYRKEHPSPSALAMSAALWAGFSGIFLMTMFATLYTWMTARDGGDFQQKLLGNYLENGGTEPMLLHFIWMVPVSAVVAAGVVSTRNIPADSFHYKAMARVAIMAAGLILLKDYALVDRPVTCIPGYEYSEKTDGCTHPHTTRLAAVFVDMIASFVAVMFLCQRGDAGRCKKQ